eukprot:scaffold76635_cov63-Phaeocystis_antarctica.AAC.3
MRASVCASAGAAAGIGSASTRWRARRPRAQSAAVCPSANLMVRLRRPPTTLVRRQRVGGRGAHEVAHLALARLPHLAILAPALTTAERRLVVTTASATALAAGGVVLAELARLEAHAEPHPVEPLELDAAAVPPPAQRAQVIGDLQPRLVTATVGRTQLDRRAAPNPPPRARRVGVGVVVVGADGVQRPRPRGGLQVELRERVRVAAAAPQQAATGGDGGGAEEDKGGAQRSALHLELHAHAHRSDAKEGKVANATHHRQGGEPPRVTHPRRLRVKGSSPRRRPQPHLCNGNRGAPLSGGGARAGAWEQRPHHEHLHVHAHAHAHACVYATPRVLPARPDAARGGTCAGARCVQAGGERGRPRLARYAEHEEADLESRIEHVARKRAKARSHEKEAEEVQLRTNEVARASRQAMRGRQCEACKRETGRVARG